MELKHEILNSAIINCDPAPGNQVMLWRGYFYSLQDEHIQDVKKTVLLK